MMREKRVSLTALALTKEDEECMNVIAEVFQSPRAGFMEHIYWEDLKDTMETASKDAVDDDISDSCTVM